MPHPSSQSKWTVQPNWRAPPTASPTPFSAAMAEAQSHHGGTNKDALESASAAQGHRFARLDPSGPYHLNQTQNQNQIQNSMPAQNSLTSLPPMSMELTGTRVWDPTVHSWCQQPLQPLQNPGQGSRPLWERQEGFDVMHPDPNYVSSGGLVRMPQYVSGSGSDPGMLHPIHLRDGVTGNSCINGGGAPVNFRKAMSARRKQLRGTSLGAAGSSDADTGSSQSDYQNQDGRVRRVVSWCQPTPPPAPVATSPPPPPAAPVPAPSVILPPSPQVRRHADGSVKAANKNGSSASALLVAMDEHCKDWLPHVNGATKFPPTLFGPSQNALAVFMAVEAAAIEAGGSRYDHHRSNSCSLPRHSTHITGSCRTSCDQSGTQHATNTNNHPPNESWSAHHPSHAAARQSPNNLATASILWRATPVRSPIRNNNSPVAADYTYSNVTAQLASSSPGSHPSPPHVHYDNTLARHTLGGQHHTHSVNSLDSYTSPASGSPACLYPSHSGNGSESSTFLTSEMDGEYLQGTGMDVGGQRSSPTRSYLIGLEPGADSDEGEEVPVVNYWYEDDGPCRPLEVISCRKTFSTRQAVQPFNNPQALLPLRAPRKVKGESSPMPEEVPEGTVLPPLLVQQAPTPEHTVVEASLGAMDSFDSGVYDSEDARLAARFIAHETQQGSSVSLPHLVNPPTILGRLLGHTVAGFALAASHEQLLLQQQQQQQGNLNSGSSASHLASNASGRPRRMAPGYAQERPSPQR